MLVVWSGNDELWKVVARFCQYEDSFKDGDDIQEATGMLRTKRVGNLI